MASTKLQKTFSSAGNRKTFTFSVWIKRANVASQAVILDSNYSGGANEHRLFIDNDDILEYYDYSGSAYQFRYKTNRKLRDVNGWYHIVCSVDTTQGTAGDRVKIYINGVRETSFSTAQNPSQNHDCILNNDQLHQIGTKNAGASFFDGSMSHIHFVDGTAYQASTFGSIDNTTGEWQIDTSPSVTYGTNGFFILKDGNSVTDQSNNSNNFTVASGTLTKSEDCPSNVFPTWNKLDPMVYSYNGGTSNGNTVIQTTTSEYPALVATMGANKGKYYWEVKLSAQSSGTYAEALVGVCSTQITGTQQELGDRPNDYGYYSGGGGSGDIRNNNSSSSYGTAWGVNTIVCVALDLDNNKLYFRRDSNAWENSGDPTSGSTGTGAVSITDPDSTDLGFYFPAVGSWSTGQNVTFQANFGNGYFGTTAISSEGTNASGIGKFEYDVPTGYTALSTKGLNL
jgi:hypothetical protein